MQIRSHSRGGVLFCAAIVLAALAQAALIPQAQARTLDTAYGDIEIDGQPERVVTLYEGALDTALTAGVTPLGAVATRGGDGVADYLSDAAAGVAIVGTARETNIEAVVAQKPDLILASSRLPEEQYTLLSQIAPTVVPRTEGFEPESWKDEARLFGKALGREEAVDDAIQAVENRSQSLAQRQPNGDTTATVARWMANGPLVMSNKLFATGLLAASGFDVKDGGVVKAGRPHSDSLSLESLSSLDSDWLFLATLNDDGEAALESARQSPAFERLSVVRQGHVVPVDGQLWTSASGPIAAQRILDDIEGMLPQ
ncbi:ABC transporter substrate-binding protein [Salinicola socius]|uniref:ABC transporter substrate-binding protein n=1 Tax=Salinicola socius TaxID=404433 RepID=A0A1Q8SN57_9GAMM|nr:ABC transporter substrate-binding protein [Salinicola socius]OLO02831.1 ABC transporter substrate-binding protein [Salinicola socius]